MTTLKIAEAWSVQFPMVKHAREVGWLALTPEEAELLRHDNATMLFPEILEDKLREFNPWLTPEQARSIVESMEALPPTIEGNREVLRWLRGERQWYDESEKRDRAVRVVDFAHPGENELHVTWEWKIEPPARPKGNRADVIFILNGIPVAIVEHKNPKDGDALARGIKQLRRYEKETPELLAQPQLYNVTHLIGYWYGVTWNTSRRNIVKWKHSEDEEYRAAVHAFFEPAGFLRTLQDWIFFYAEDGETKKSVLREHQRQAVDKIVRRCADLDRNRGLIWHTQGSGKTFTLLTAARQILEDKARFSNATVILVVDRTELEGQLKEWVERLLGEMQQKDIAIRQAKSRQELQDILDSDFRGLVVSMIHKFEEIRKDSSGRDNIYVFIDEAHRSVAADLGSCLMAAVPKATIIGFTGTPVHSSRGGSTSFDIFGAQDEDGFLDRYSISESIQDETTLPIKYMLAPSSMRMSAEDLDEQFFALAEEEEVTDVDELNRVLDRAVGLRLFLSAEDRVEKVARFVAQHFQENVLPLGYKAFLVAVDRETCVRYKRALDRHLPPEWSEAIYSSNPNDAVDRPDVHDLQLTSEREKEVRRLFKKPGEEPKILIVTDKLLTGYDAPVLYTMYLDKPMRDHVLLQAISRVNRPYIDDLDTPKRVGLIVDFVGILSQLNKALRFDSDVVKGALEDLDVLMADLLEKIGVASDEYLRVDGDASADAQLESLVYGRFLEPDVRKKFFDDYKEIEGLWEILSPSKELRDHIKTYKHLSQLYAAVRNAYSQTSGFLADLEHKTRRLVEETVVQDDLGRFSKAVSFDAETVESMKEEDGPDEGKVYNLLRGLRNEMDEDPATAVVLEGLLTRSERIIRDLEERKITGLAAMDELAALAAEKSEARRRAEESGLSDLGFAVFWVMEQDKAIVSSGLDLLAATREIEEVMSKFPNWRESPDEKRALRRNLYKPLLGIPVLERAAVIEQVMQIFERAG
jgi:type I restriction enzyme, R subunit